MMSMKCPWLFFLLVCGTAGHALLREVHQQSESPHHAKHQRQQSHRNNLRRKAHKHKEAAAADYSDTSIHGDDAQYFSQHSDKLASTTHYGEEPESGAPASQVETPVKPFTPYHLLARQGAHNAAVDAADEIPGVDYGAVKYPDLMADIEDLYADLKAHKNDKKKAKKVMQKAAHKVNETQEAHENVTETVEEHVEDLEANASTVEYIDVADCMNSFRHKSILKHLKKMHPADLEGNGGIIDFDIETMCRNVAQNGTISKRDFVSGFLRMVQKSVNNKPLDCESFAYYVMSGGAFDEKSEENRHLAVDNIDLAKEIERIRLGPDAPPLPKPKLQDIMLWQLGKRQDPADEAHQEMDEVHKALEEGDADDALENLKDLKHKMGKAQEHLEEKASSHGWKIKRHSVEAGLKGNESLEEGSLHMRTNDTLHRLGTSVDEQLANFDKCDKDGDGELWEKEFLACELKKVETGVVEELKASGEGVRSPGHHCAWRLTTLTSGHLYQQTEALNEKLRMMNSRLHDELRGAEGEEEYMLRRTDKHTDEEVAMAPAVALPPSVGAPAAAVPPSPAAFYAEPANQQPETAD